MVTLSKPEETYYERMDTAVDDKVRLINIIKTHYTNPSMVNVVDLGAGSGLLSKLLIKEHFNVTAVDALPEAVERLNEAGIPAVQLNAFNVDKLEQKYDVVIASSIFHEIFSYGNNGKNNYSYKNVTKVLKKIFNILKPGGLLLIRDGVKPEPVNMITQGYNEISERAYASLVNQYKTVKEEETKQAWKQTLTGQPRETPLNNDSSHLNPNSKLNHTHAILSFLNAETTQLAEAYINNSPLVLNKTLKYEWLTPNSVKATHHAIMELAYTITWGENSLQREMCEQYGIYSQQEYVTQLEKQGYIVKHTEKYVQQGYVTFLNKNMHLNTEWYPTNAIWVAQKPE